MPDTPIDITVYNLAEQIIHTASRKKLSITTAESCTGGLIMGALTEISGSSAVIDRGFITYSNVAKQDMLGVDRATLRRLGAVSEPVAHQMAAGALTRANARLSVAVTGIAGPTGGSPNKPVGTVCFGFAQSGHTIGEIAPEESNKLSITTETKLFPGPSRYDVRMQTVTHALEILLAMMK